MLNGMKTNGYIPNFRKGLSISFYNLLHCLYAIKHDTIFAICQKHRHDKDSFGTIWHAVVQLARTAKCYKP